MSFHVISVESSASCDATKMCSNMCRKRRPEQNPSLTSSQGGRKGSHSGIFGSHPELQCQLPLNALAACIDGAVETHHLSSTTLLEKWWCLLYQLAHVQQVSLQSCHETIQLSHGWLQLPGWQLVKKIKCFLPHWSPWRCNTAQPGRGYGQANWSSMFIDFFM